MLKSVSNKETAIKLIQGVRKICVDGGFFLTKFVSNKQVLASIPEVERRKGVFDQDLELEILPTEKAFWNTKEDTIVLKSGSRKNQIQRAITLALTGLSFFQPSNT